MVDFAFYLYSVKCWMLARVVQIFIYREKLFISLDFRNLSDIALKLNYWTNVHLPD